MPCGTAWEEAGAVGCSGEIFCSAPGCTVMQDGETSSQSNPIHWKTSQPLLAVTGKAAEAWGVNCGGPDKGRGYEARFQRDHREAGWPGHSGQQVSAVLPTSVLILSLCYIGYPWSKHVAAAILCSVTSCYQSRLCVCWGTCLELLSTLKDFTSAQ